jgi:hypothetical protein
MATYKRLDIDNALILFVDHQVSGQPLHKAIRGVALTMNFSLDLSPSSVTSLPMSSAPTFSASSGSPTTSRFPPSSPPPSIPARTAPSCRRLRTDSLTRRLSAVLARSMPWTTRTLPSSSGTRGGSRSSSGIAAFHSALGLHYGTCANDHQRRPDRGVRCVPRPQPDRAGLRCLRRHGRIWNSQRGHPERCP